MKKAIAVLLAVVMTLGVVSCSKEPERKRKKDSGSKSKKTEEVVEDDEEDPLEDLLETTRDKKKKDKTDKTKESEQLPDDIFLLDDKSPEELVEVAKSLADVKDNDTFKDIFKKLPVVPSGYDPNDLDKYDAYGIHFEWSYALKNHKGIKGLIYKKTTYKYPDVKNIEISEDSYVEITYYFGNEEDCMAAEEAFYNYLCSLGELNTEKSKRREDQSGVLCSTLVFKAYPVEDSGAFDSPKFVYDEETDKMYYEPSYMIFMTNTETAGCYLQVQIPIGNHIYQGGK